MSLKYPPVTLYTDGHVDLIGFLYMYIKRKKTVASACRITGVLVESFTCTVYSYFIISTRIFRYVSDFIMHLIF